MLKTKKGILSVFAGFVLAILMAFTLVGCGETVEGSEVTQEQWNAALGAENLENVTITFEGDVHRNVNGTSQTVSEEQTIKFADGKMQVTVVDNGTEALNSVFTDNNVEVNKKSYLQILTTLIEQREKFVFDKEKKGYVLNDTVTTSINESMYDETHSFTVTMKDSVVRFNSEGKPTYFACDFTQDGGDTGFMAGVIVNTKGEWTFSDYGTTEIK